MNTKKITLKELIKRVESLEKKIRDLELKTQPPIPREYFPKNYGNSVYICSKCGGTYLIGSSHYCG